MNENKLWDPQKLLGYPKNFLLLVYANYLQKGILKILIPVLTVMKLS